MIKVENVQGPGPKECAVCNGFREEREGFCCSRCMRFVCLKHKDVEFLVCPGCAAVKREEQEKAAGPLCQFQDCGRRLPAADAFTCQRCGRLMCRTHADAEVAGHCLTCAESVRSEQFAVAAGQEALNGSKAEAVRALAAMTQATPPFQARIWTQPAAFVTTRDIATVPRRSRGAFRLADPFTLNAQVERDCHLTLIDLGTSGNVYLLLVNHPLRGGQPVALSGPDDLREWRISPPTGVERLKALFTLRPLELFPGAQDFSSLGNAQTARDIAKQFKQATQTLHQMPANSWVDAACDFVVGE